MYFLIIALKSNQGYLSIPSLIVVVSHTHSFSALVSGTQVKSNICPPYEGPPYKKEGPPTGTEVLNSTASMLSYLHTKNSNIINISFNLNFVSHPSYTHSKNMIFNITTIMGARRFGDIMGFFK